MWLFSLIETKGRIARWIEILSSFDFTVEYRPGPKHGNSDAMSRCINPRDCDCHLIDNLEYMKYGPCAKCTKRAHDTASSMTMSPYSVEYPMFSEDPELVNTVKTRSQTEDENIWTIWKAGYSITERKSFQENDDDIGPLMQWKIDGARPLRSEIEKNSPATRHYWFLWDSLILKNGILLKEYMKFYTKWIIQFYLVIWVKRKQKKILTFGFNNAKFAVLLSHLQKHPWPLLRVCQLVHPAID
jgi:hypothetical protein